MEGLEKDYGEADAERLILEYGSKLGLPMGEVELTNLRKGDEPKAILAADGGERRMDWQAAAFGASWLRESAGRHREAGS